MRRRSTISRPAQSRVVLDRFKILFFVAMALFLVVAGKLVWLQIIHGDAYDQLAEEQNSRGVVLPARRGTIYARDVRTDERTPLAVNSTTYTVFADPTILELGTEAGLADSLAEILWTDEPREAEEEVEIEIQNPDAEESEDGEAEIENEETPIEERQNLEEAKNDEERDEIDTRDEYRNWILEKLTTKNALRRILTKATPEQIADIEAAVLPGVSTDGELVVVNPTLVSDAVKESEILATILEGDYNDIFPALQPRKVRYVKLAGKVSPADAEKILALDTRGVGVIPEYRRVYPEGDLGSQVVGFLAHDSNGAYGIEGAINKDLKGQDGLRRTQVDPFNRQITVGEITMEDAQNGADVVLTIDRAIQEIVERHLSERVDEFRADSGQAIVMDPYTGAILALAHYPSFDPNNFGEVYDREELVRFEREVPLRDEETGEIQKDPETGEDLMMTEEWWETADGEEIETKFEVDYIIRDGFYFPVFIEKNAEGEIIKSIYKNRLAEGVFSLKAANEPYEPGSVFKPIVMAMAIDAGEVTPTTRSPYNGPVELDEKLRGKNITIKNAEGSYHGYETMMEVIANSSNIGMTFVAQQLGRATFYDYLKKFGFSERTDVEFEGENAGQLENYTMWTDSELITKAFGQGLTTNLFQMAAGYSALANGGLLMKPFVVAEQIFPDGKKITTEPETVRRVIDPETSAEITQMLVNSVKKGYAKPAGIDGYFIAGKTGTSQTYSKSGRALNDVGTTIAAFGGYAPASDPKFVLIVKIDRPRRSEWGAAVAAPLFHDITEELLTYFAVPPNED